MLVTSISSWESELPEGRETGRMVSVGRPARVRSASACSAESGEVAGELGETRRLSQAREIFIGRKGTRGVVGRDGKGGILFQ